ncbi:type I 3-dehydroquinase-domain-containing protein [Apodospora peruviana]|uniref:Type I 3-dehydroquinase-domain-containing protein n=1 Tax=Apodospora peruviana TaxID=516989 RepID=A0AAE0M5A3_9PEZI|nr:type I 3-dehydroquinase-domain-containing protein [Apodospora peruviana]
MSAPKNERVFEHNASIVLVGCRGAGKRTLGFIGALHLGRRLVTEDHYFEKVTGLSRGEYLSRNGKERFARQNSDVFKRMLDSNRHGCVIECGMGSLADEALFFLRAYSLRNPVVYVHREKEQILLLLDAVDAEQLLRADEKHKTCSNFEYYNLYDDSNPGKLPNSGPGTPMDGRQGGASKLLNVREDFTTFLDLITGRGATRAWLESPFSVKAIPPEYRSQSYALRLRLSYLLEMDLEWEDFEARGDCIELIIDRWPDDMLNIVARQVALIRRKLGLPIIFHAEETPRGERRRSPEEKDAMDYELLELGLRLGVEYISLDLQRDEKLVNRVLAHRGRSRVIGNFWYPSMGALPWLDDRQIGNYKRAKALGCDVVRIVRFCAGDSDPDVLEHFKRKVDEAVPDPKPPLVAYDFSVLGVRTPFQTNILGPVKHPDVHNGRDPLTTICAANNAIDMLFRQFLLEPLQFYVLGSNVSYSLSPAMQTAAYEFSGMPHSFRAVTCSTQNGLNQICLSDTFGGACLTAPFKVAIMPHLKVKSHHATAIGAVNVLLPLRGQNGTILDHANSRNKGGPAQDFFGDNTDWSSILTCLRRAISPRNFVQPSRTTGLVVGAGGMARAAIYALIQLGCRNIFIYNRTTQNAIEVARHFNEWAAAQGIITGGSSSGGNNGSQASTTPPLGSAPLVTEICRVIPSLAHPWPAGYQLPTMVISCVPATAVDGNPPADFEMPQDWLRSPTGGVVVELAYEPLITPLVAQMQAFRSHSNNGERSPSWTTVDGLEVVGEMAIEAFELMTGRPAPKRLMKEVGRKTWEQQQQRGYMPTSYYDLLQ